MNLDFSTIKLPVEKQLKEMSKGQLFKVDVDKDTLWDTYINSFPEGTNPIFRERTVHDCNCCKNFIRNVGDVVSIIDGRVISIWDIPKINNAYDNVVEALRNLVHSAKIKSPWLTTEKQYGSKNNVDNYDLNISWSHFYVDVPKACVFKDASTYASRIEGTYSVFLRGMREFKDSAIEQTIELCESSLYRGEEFLPLVRDFYALKQEFGEYSGDLETFCWDNIQNYAGRIRNTAIGTLLQDLSEGKDLEYAVTAFETKVAPENYKRTSAIVTPRMIKDAQKTMQDAGLLSALNRRHAIETDITVNNVIFADRQAKAAMNGDVFDTLLEKTAETIKKADLVKVPSISIEAFLSSILPNSASLELLIENSHTRNFMTLIAPEDFEAPLLFKWGNPFSWAYNGDITDASSVREKVKDAGGNVSGPLRFSINWAEDDWASDNSDLDAWASEPGGVSIGFSSKYRKDRYDSKRSPCSGQLDIDVISPNRFNHKNIVENIVYTDKKKLKPGTYKFWVNQYNYHNSQGFKAEVEMDGEIFSYTYDRPVKGNVHVAEVTIAKDGSMDIKHLIPHTSISKNVWEITTQQFHRVSMLMHSPNHWDGEQTGNRHYFFLIDGCKNPEPVRGYFNEYLRTDLNKHRKVFELLGNKTKIPAAEKQLSGIGLSSTRNDRIYVRANLYGQKKIMEVTFN